MKQALLLLVLLPFLSTAQQQRTLSGVITDGFKPMADVKVVIVDSDMVTATDTDGNYKIVVETGDTVEFSYVGMKTITIMVEDVTRILNLEMFPETTALEEVVVSKKLNKSQKQLEEEFRYNPGIVKTGFKYIEPKRFPGQTRQIIMDDIEDPGQCILDLLVDNLGDVSRLGTCAGGGTLHLGNNPLGAPEITIYEVDGIIYNEAPIWLNPKMIERIAIFAGEYWRGYYGDAALNGVVIINTPGLSALAGVVDKARLHDNFIETPNLANQYLDENKKRAQNQKTISGTVTDGNMALANVNVSVESTGTTAVTNEKGKYKIKARVGDIIKFSYIGLKTVSIRVEDVTRVFNPIMIPDVTELDEVVVEGSKRTSQSDMAQDYEKKKTIIKTAFGYLDAEKSPGQIRMLAGDDINTANVCILDLLRTGFPGMTVIGDCQAGGSVNIRGGNSINSASVAIFDVDGQIFEDAPIWLDLNNIKRLAIFSNFALTSRYGSIGRGGVVVINTINGTLTNKGTADQARLRNNFVYGRILTKTDIDNNKATYLKELESSSSFENAKAIFKKYSETYRSSPYFYLDAYTYFFTKWNQETYADAIIKDNFTLFQDNALLLKALAYEYEAQERFKKANETYKSIFILRPKYAQSYLDLANSYRDIQDYKQAAAIYSRFDYLVGQALIEKDTIDFETIMEREFNNLLALKKTSLIDEENLSSVYVAEEEYKGTRLVFEWNDSHAEFDLQFVNPGKQYFIWNYNLIENSEAINRHQRFGYNIKEYLLDNSLPGNWGVNVKYYGNKSLTPTYLKATVYYNYGTNAQRKETKVFKLTLKDVNQQLFNLQVSGAITAN